MKKALLLLDKGYEVHSIIRRTTIREIDVIRGLNRKVEGRLRFRKRPSF